jgi:hypothetical protein
LFTAAQKLRQTSADGISAVVGGLSDAGMGIFLDSLISYFRIISCTEGFAQSFELRKFVH